jgi:gamma-glutamylcyclotransferase (GGCT)/AIG2-like uncharacterized protein YtfP
MRQEYLFLYGTLMRKYQIPAHTAVTHYCDYLSKGSFQGKLYLIEDYPGAIPTSNPKNRVKGEVYTIQESIPLFETLDTYEECSPRFPEPHEYVRQQQPVLLENGESVLAWMYLYARPLLNKSPILSGQFNP